MLEETPKHTNPSAVAASPQNQSTDSDNSEFRHDSHPHNPSGGYAAATAMLRMLRMLSDAHPSTVLKPAKSFPKQELCGAELLFLQPIPSPHGQ